LRRTFHVSAIFPQAPTMGVAVSQQTYPPQLQGLTVHNFEENKERQRHYGDAKLGIRLPNLQTVSQFGVAGLNAATSSSNLLLKTEAGCCVKKERIPWAWHDFCRALHDPVNHGRLFRHLALISAVDPDRMKTQFESEAKEGSLYFKLERKGGGLANFCVAVVRDINLARKLIPMELVPYARKLVSDSISFISLCKCICFVDFQFLYSCDVIHLSCQHRRRCRSSMYIISLSLYLSIYLPVSHTHYVSHNLFVYLSLCSDVCINI